MSISCHVQCGNYANWFLSASWRTSWTTEREGYWRSCWEEGSDRWVLRVDPSCSRKHPTSSALQSHIFVSIPTSQDTKEEMWRIPSWAPNSVGAVTKVPPTEWLNQQKFIALPFWRLEFQKPRVGRVCSFWGLGGEGVPHLYPSFWWLSGNLWCSSAHTCISLRFTWSTYCVHGVCLQISPFNKTSCIRLGPSLMASFNLVTSESR